MEFVTVLNRSSKPLEAVWNGVRHVFPSGKTPNTALAIAEAAKRQNPIMGSEDPYTLQKDYLISILEQGDPETPAEQNLLARQVTNRSKLPQYIQKVETIEAPGLYRDVKANLPVENGFLDASQDIQSKR